MLTRGVRKSSEEVKEEVRDLRDTLVYLLAALCAALMVAALPLRAG